MLRRAFTLLEVLVVLGITLLLLGIGMVNYRGGTRKATPQSLATALVAELEAARMRAISGHTFVALEFPSNGQGCCQSFARWEGMSKARYAKGRNFSREFAGSSIFIGSWPLSSGTFSTDRPANGMEIPGFTLATLFNPIPTSYLLVFTPAGGVLSNDLPMLDGRYQIVVGASLTAAPAAAPPGTPTVSPRPPYFRLQALTSPQRIEIDTIGGVSLKTDLANASGVQLQPSGFDSLSAPVAPAPPAWGNQTPVVQSIVLSPGAPNLPGGVEGAISKDDYLRLKVEATDNDGDPLLCEWSSQNGGAFTTGGATRMRWDEGKQRWTSTWTFRANPNDPPLTHYDLECRVTDPRNTLATAAAGVTLTQTVELRLKPFFAAAPWPLHSLIVCNTDGSDMLQVPTPSLLPSFVSVHPDGKTIAFTDTQYAANEFHIWSINKDGSGLRRLTSATTMAAAGGYSPDGTTYAFTRGGRVCLMPACGEVDPTPGAAAQLPPQSLAIPGGTTSWRRIGFNATSRKLIVTGRINAGSDEALFTYDRDLPGWHQLSLPPISRALTPNAIMYQACYSRDPATLNQLFCIYYTGSTWAMCLVNDDGSNLRPIVEPTGAGFLYSPALTRDNRGILYQAGSQVVHCDFNFATATASNPQVISDGHNIHEIATW